MTGIKVAAGDDGEIFVARAARGNPLGKAGSAFQIDIEMEEVESLSFRVALQIFVAEVFVFLLYLGQMLLFDLQIGKIGHDGLHGNGIESLIRDEEHVLGKIEVFRRKRAAHIIALFPAEGNETF